MIRILIILKKHSPVYISPLPPFAALIPFTMFLSTLVLFAIPVILPPSLYAQTENSDNQQTESKLSEQDQIQNLKIQIETASNGNRYEEALRLIETGKEKFQKSPIFYEVSGSLFMNKELNKIALNEYLKAQNLYLEDSKPIPDTVILEIATLYGLLDKNEQSLSYFEKLLAYPDYVKEARRSLSWMYFKTSRFDEGIAKLESWLLQEFDPSLAHSLGLLYASNYDYEKSFKNYMDSIKYAQENNLNDFAATAYYNLSLLEISFYHFENAYNYAEKSLNLVDRPNGYLGRANITILKMDLDKTLDDLLLAKNNMEHPIPLLLLTELYLLFGAYKNASVTLSEIELWEDSSWMYSFGYNKVSFALTLSKLYFDYYSGLYHLEKSRVCITLGKIIKRQANLFKYKAYSLFHKVRKRNYERILSKEELKKGNTFDSEWIEYSRSDGYKRRSIKYLKKADSFETKKIPLSQPLYTKEWGMILGDSNLLHTSIDQLHPEWEKQFICDSYKELILLYKKIEDKPLRQKNISFLYSINPGGLRQYGILLPLSLDFPQPAQNNKDKKNRKIEKIFTRLIKKTGTEIISDNSSCFSLRLFWDDKNEGTFSYYLFDQEKNLLLFGNETLSDPASIKSKDFAVIVNKIFNRIYAPVSQGEPLY